MAGKSNELVISGMRSADNAVCCPNYHISPDKRHSGHKGYWSGRFPVWEGLGIYFCKAVLWNPSFYHDIRIWNLRGNPHRGSGGAFLCCLSGKNSSKENWQHSTECSRSSCRNPVCRLWTGGNDNHCSMRKGDISSPGWCKPLFGNSCPCRYDSALCHFRIGNGNRSCAKGI